MQTSRWPVSKLPIAHLEPFPYHKGELYVELLDRLAKYVTDQLHPNLRETVEHIVEEMEHVIADTHAKYVDGIQDFQRIHDAFMTDVNSALMALNDNASADLVKDPGTQLGRTLRELFADRDDFIHLADTAVHKSGTIEYWVHPEGVDEPDRGTQDEPMRTLRYAVDQANAFIFDDNATIDLRLFPEVYHESLVIPNVMRPVHYRILGADVGGHPNKPLTRFIYDGGRVQAITNTTPNTILTIHDVQYTGWRGSGSDNAISATRNHLYTRNVHISDSGAGIVMQNGNLDVKGGIIENCGTGIRSYMASRHAIGTQNAGHRLAGPIIRNCSGTGVSIGEATSGHIDWCIIEDCGTGLSFDRNATGNPSGTAFYRNNVGISLSNGSATFTSNNVFGTGSDANGRAVNVTSGAQLSSNEMWTSNVTTNSLTERLVRDVNSSDTVVQGNGDRVAHRACSATLQSAWWNDESNGFQPDKAYTMKVVGRVDNLNGVFEPRIILGTATEHPVVQASKSSTNDISFDFEITADVVFIGRSEQLATLKVVMDDQPPLFVSKRLAVDMSSNKNLATSITLRGPNSAETTMTLYSQQVWMR